MANFRFLTNFRFLILYTIHVNKLSDGQYGFGTDTNLVGLGSVRVIFDIPKIETVLDTFFYCNVPLPVLVI